MKQTERVTQALALVAQGKTPYRAAKMTGIALSTIYKAIKRGANQPTVTVQLDK